MNDPNNAQLMAKLPNLLQNSHNLPRFPEHPTTGIASYVDTTSSIPGDAWHLVLDGLGAASGGSVGHNFADSFTGSYAESWAAVYRGPHTATVYVTVNNVTDLNSVAHPGLWPTIYPPPPGLSLKPNVDPPWGARVPSAGCRRPSNGRRR
jgi:hypothetical protein